MLLRFFLDTARRVSLTDVDVVVDFVDRTSLVRGALVGGWPTSLCNNDVAAVVYPEVAFVVTPTRATNGSVPSDGTLGVDRAVWTVIEMPRGLVVACLHGRLLATLTSAGLLQLWAVDNTVTSDADGLTDAVPVATTDVSRHLLRGVDVVPIGASDETYGDNDGESDGGVVDSVDGGISSGGDSGHCDDVDNDGSDGASVASADDNAGVARGGESDSGGDGGVFLLAQHDVATGDTQLIWCTVTSPAGILIETTTATIPWHRPLDSHSAVSVIKGVCGFDLLVSPPDPSTQRGPPVWAVHRALQVVLPLAAPTSGAVTRASMLANRKNAALLQGAWGGVALSPRA